MSNKEEANKTDFSLQGEIKKRKTQEIQRVIEDKRIAAARGAVLPKHDAPQTTQARDVGPSQADTTKRATQVSRAVSTSPDRPARARTTSQSVTSDKRATQIHPLPRRRLKQSQKIYAIVSVATLLIMMVCASTLIVASNTSVQPTATLLPLPIMSANEVVAYLKKSGIPIINAQEYAVPNESWQAHQEIQFDVYRGAAKGTFIVLSYPSSESKVPDIFRAGYSGKFREWKLIEASNILILISPETSQDLKNDMGSHITQLLLAPYRPFLSTTTPQSTPKS